MTEKQRSLIGGISVLGAAGLICKMVGVLYRIPLANMIGGQGLGLYQQVMPAYNLLLAVTSAGIPVAISRMVSHYVTLGEHGNARRARFGEPGAARNPGKLNDRRERSFTGTFFCFFHCAAYAAVLYWSLVKASSDNRRKIYAIRIRDPVFSHLLYRSPDHRRRRDRRDRREDDPSKTQE